MSRPEVDGAAADGVRGFVPANRPRRDGLAPENHPRRKRPDARADRTERPARSPYLSSAPLRPGDTVRLIAPSGPTDEESLLRAIAQLESWGLRVVPGENVRARHPRVKYLAGTDEQRRADLVDAWCDPDTDAVIALRGGYGAMRLLDGIDFDLMRRHMKRRDGRPKLLTGSSDITALHQAWEYHLGVATLFCPMVGNDPFKNSAVVPTEVASWLFEPWGGRELGFPAAPEGHGEPGAAASGADAENWSQTDIPSAENYPNVTTSSPETSAPGAAAADQATRWAKWSDGTAGEQTRTTTQDGPAAGTADSAAAGADSAVAAAETDVAAAVPGTAAAGASGAGTAASEGDGEPGAAAPGADVEKWSQTDIRSAESYPNVTTSSPETSAQATAARPGFAARPLSRARTLVPGRARGRLGGGNLSLVAAGIGSPELAGASRWRETNGPTILMLEDVDEELYRLDNLMVQLVRGGWFTSADAVVLGSWEDCAPVGEVEALVMDYLGDAGIPIISEMGFGHDPDAPSLPLGVDVTLEAPADGRPRMWVDPAEHG